MIDRKELKDLVNDTRILILSRIHKLSEAANLLNYIEDEAYEDTNDDYLAQFIRIQCYYRQTLKDLDEEFSEAETKLWDKIASIDN